MAGIKKEKLLALVKSLEQTNNKIEKGEYVDIDTLTWCQAQAIDLGDYIELKYKKNDITSVIHALEEYCECVYQLSQIEGRDKKQESARKIRVLLASIQHDITYKLPCDKKEVVFLPYKASMWDSLESIYLAAREDESCDAYVIPIPYYDKNPDGSFSQMYYEGDQFPENIPITSWQDYSLEENRPDVIFIHMAYDDWNHITSTHPHFYAKNLKQYTDMLVYVPYFVLGDMKPGDSEAIEKMKHFCFLPGIIFADRVIVQSEDMRKIYMEEYTKAAKKEGLPDYFTDENFLEKKFLGLGSPKFDRAVRITKSNTEIPEEWLKYMMRPDGSRKKAVLYNNSISALLEHGEVLLKKMAEILEVFKAHQDEAVLWWRPHPLIPSTIKSMRPALWMEYRKLVREYKEEAWGIYDDTADLDRAIAWTDAYYGEPSSMVQLYQCVNKPIMMLYGKRADINSKRLRFLDCYDDGDHLWFCALGTCGVFRFDKKNKTTDLICETPVKIEWESYRAIFVKDGKVYLAPLFEDSILIFDLAAGMIRKHSIKPFIREEDCRPSANTAKFHKIVEYGRYLFFLPLSLGMIIRLDTETEKIDSFDGFVNLLTPVINAKDDVWFKKVCRKDNKIYLACAIADAVVEFNMDTYGFRLVFSGEEDRRYSGITYQEDNLWLLGQDGCSLYRWNESKGIEKAVDLEAKGKYNNLLCTGDYILRVPCKYNLEFTKILSRDPSNIKTICLGKEEKEENTLSSLCPENSAVLYAGICEGVVYAYSTARDSLCVFDTDGQLCNKFDIEVQKGDARAFYEMQNRRLAKITDSYNGVVHEHPIGMRLENFIGMIAADSTDDPDIHEIRGYGSKIYDYIKEIE